MRTTVGLAALAAVLVCAPAASAESITAQGLARVEVEVGEGDRDDNNAIRDAVEAARSAGIPRAIDSARENAEEIAAAANLTVGAVQSVDDNVFFGYGPPYGAIAPFGPDKYCGVVSRRKRVRKSDGRLVIRRVRTRRCYVPREVTTQLAVTFAATPKT
jgi:hypothetical protein